VSVAVFVLPWISAGPAGAQHAKAPPAVAVISPIFGQLLAFSQPANFAPVFENANATNYVRESVLRGRTARQWTQMISVTGAKGLAGKAEITPGLFAGSIADGFQKACPDTFTAASLGEVGVAGHIAFAAVAGCGTISDKNGTRSETALIIAIKGASDYYTIQWAERAPPVRQAPAIDKTVWARRLAQLGPIRLCPIVPGEKAPYPSCAKAG
jgi:hypothetical protein